MALSHINVHVTPLPSEKICKLVPCARYPPSLSFRTGNRRAFPIIVKAVADDKSDNLDHLQRATTHRQQPQPRRLPQVPPPGLWDRYPSAKTVQQMMDTMERMMEDPFAYSNTWLSASLNGRDGYDKGRTPWAIKEGEKDYKMRFDMPGMTKDDVKVWIEEKMLVLKAEKVPGKAQEESSGSVNEDNGDDEWPTKSYGRYSYRIALPENVEFDKIKAEVRDGVLYVTIPKASSNSKILDIDVQ